MRRLWRAVVFGAMLLATLSATTSSARAEIVSVQRCAPASVRITDYNTLVGAGNVNDLYWIQNVSSETCSLRGYVRVSFFGNYGAFPKVNNPKLLPVQQLDTPGGGTNANDIGGLNTGFTIPTVILKPKGFASFWIYGHDESSYLKNGRPTRCISSYKMLARLPGSTTPVDVSPLKSNGFFWCGGTKVHPMISGKSGSEPARSLTSYFG